MSFDLTNDNVVSSVALVLEALINQIQSKFPNITFIYDEALGFDTGARLLRDNNNLRDKFTNKLPALLFRRSVLRPQEEGIGRRSISQRAIRQVNSTHSALYRIFSGTFDFEFNFITTKMSQFENFEVSWLTEYVGSEKELKVNVPEIGELTYYARYNTLDDKVVNSQGSYYKTLMGTINVRGVYLVFEPANTETGYYKHITEIRKRIINFYNSVIEEELIQLRS